MYKNFREVYAEFKGLTQLQRIATDYECYAEVEGVVANVHMNSADITVCVKPPYITEITRSLVFCDFPISAKAMLVAVNMGEKVKIRGRFVLGESWRMHNCTLVREGAK